MEPSLVSWNSSMSCLVCLVNPLTQCLSCKTVLCKECILLLRKRQGLPHQIGIKRVYVGLLSCTECGFKFMDLDLY